MTQTIQQTSKPLKLAAGITALAVSPSAYAAILAKLDACFCQRVDHGRNGSALPPHLLCVECLQANDGGDVNLSESRQL